MRIFLLWRFSGILWKMYTSGLFIGLPNEGMNEAEKKPKKNLYENFENGKLLGFLLGYLMRGMKARGKSVAKTRYLNGHEQEIGSRKPNGERSANSDLNVVKTTANSG